MEGMTQSKKVVDTRAGVIIRPSMQENCPTATLQKINAGMGCNEGDFEVGGMCRFHGRGKPKACNIDGCLDQTKPRVSGVHLKHGTKKKPKLCCFEGCESQTKEGLGGLCRKQLKLLKAKVVCRHGSKYTNAVD